MKVRSLRSALLVACIVSIALATDASENKPFADRRCNIPTKVTAAPLYGAALTILRSAESEHGNLVIRFGREREKQLFDVEAGQSTVAGHFDSIKKQAKSEMRVSISGSTVDIAFGKSCPVLPALSEDMTLEGTADECLSRIHYAFSDFPVHSNIISGLPAGRATIKLSKGASFAECMSAYSDAFNVIWTLEVSYIDNPDPATRDSASSMWAGLKLTRGADTRTGTGR